MCPKLNREIFGCSSRVQCRLLLLTKVRSFGGKEAVIVRMRTGLLPRVVVFIPFLWGGVVRAQESAAALQQTPRSNFVREEAELNVKARCLEPPPLVRLQDYQGKFKKTVGIFARKLERRSVPSSHYRAGALLCTLEPKDKFELFLRNTIDPGTFLSVAFNSGLDQAQNGNPSFHQGAAGYGRRFGAISADAASGSFFGDFVYPTVFGEDPRYYRLAHGSGGTRLLHALGHVFVAHREDGTHMVNASQWFAAATVVVLSNTYHPDNQRGLAPAATRVGYVAMQNIGFDVLREFWPEVARKLRLPFRGQLGTTNVLPPGAKTQSDMMAEGVREPVRK